MKSYLAKKSPKTIQELESAITDGGRFVKAIGELDLVEKEKHLLLWLAGYMDFHILKETNSFGGYETYLSRHRLAKLMSVDVRTVDYTLASLEAKGYAEKRSRQNAKGRDITNAYTVTDKVLTEYWTILLKRNGHDPATPYPSANKIIEEEDLVTEEAGQIDKGETLPPSGAVSDRPSQESNIPHEINSLDFPPQQAAGESSSSKTMEPRTTRTDTAKKGDMSLKAATRIGIRVFDRAIPSKHGRGGFIPYASDETIAALMELILAEFGAGAVKFLHDEVDKADAFGKVPPTIHWVRGWLRNNYQQRAA